MISNGFVRLPRLIETDSYAFHSRQKLSEWPGAQGVGFFVRRTFDFTERRDLDHPNLMISSIEVRKQRNAKPIIISCLYRHFTIRVNWYGQLEDFTKLLDASPNDCIINGDFNIVTFKPAESKHLLGLMEDYGFTQVIKSATRITENNKTCIDFFTNCQRYTSGVACVSLANHPMNFINLGEKSQGGTHHYITSRSFERVDEHALLEDLKQAPWSVIEVFEDVDDTIHGAKFSRK